MPNNPTRRITPATLQADKDSFDALKGISAYAPANPAYTVAAIATLRNKLDTSQEAETQALAAAAAARDEATAAEWDYHNAIIGAKEQVIAQFGKDSNEVQSVGLKKKSEYAKNTQRKGRPAPSK
ncbi:MAG: hypothetical protein ACJ741_11310 [Pyrinomonadaceae bacterium]